MNVTVDCRCTVTLHMTTERALNASAYGQEFRRSPRFFFTVDGRRRVTLQMTTERALKASAHGPVFRRCPCFFFPGVVWGAVPRRLPLSCTFRVGYTRT